MMSPRRVVALVISLVAAVFLIGAAAMAGIQQHRLRRLMMTEADRTVDDPALVRLAETRSAEPYRQHCASCHGAAMNGDSVIGAPNLIDRDWLYGDGRTSTIEQTILHGIRAGLPNTRGSADMPGFARPQPYARYAITPLSPQAIDDVVAYLAVRRGRTRATDAIARGKAVYVRSGGCFDCHGEDLQGDPAIGAPNLTDAIDLYGDGSDAALTRSIDEGRAGICPGWAGRLDPLTIRSLAVMIAARASGKG